MPGEAHHDQNPSLTSPTICQKHALKTISCQPFVKAFWILNLDAVDAHTEYFQHILHFFKPFRESLELERGGLLLASWPGPPAVTAAPLQPPAHAGVLLQLLDLFRRQYEANCSCTGKNGFSDKVKNYLLLL